MPPDVAQHTPPAGDGLHHISYLLGTIASQIGDVKSDIGQLRTDLKGEIAETRAQIMAQVQRVDVLDDRMNRLEGWRDDVQARTKEWSVRRWGLVMVGCGGGVSLIVAVASHFVPH